MQKKILLWGIALTFIFAFPLQAKALTIEEILAQIAQLQAQILALQSQLSQIQQTPTSVSSVFQKTLRMTDQDPEITELQKILRSEGLFCQRCQVTGYFGWWTKAALMNFQQRYRLPITGIVDQTTRTKLNQLAQPSSAAAPAPTPTAPSLSPTPPSPSPSSPAPAPSPDTTPPSASVTINGGDQNTRNPEVILLLTCEDSDSGIDSVRYSNLQVFTNEPWVGFSEGFRWTLSSGDTLKTVYYQCRDKTGNIATVSDTITLDANPPLRSNGSPSGVVASSNTKTISLTTNEPATCRYSLVQGTDYDAMRPEDSMSQSATTSHSITVSTSLEGTYIFAIRCKDSLGNKNADDFLISFTIGSPASTEYNMNVLVLKYFPLTQDKNSIDISITGDVGDSYSSVWQKTTDITSSLKTALEQGSSYLGYKDKNAKPSLTYTILDIKRYEEPFPTKDAPVPRYPDYAQVLSRENICSYVDNQNVQEVWIFAYQGPAKEDGAPFLNISESKMAGPHGDISNSYRYNDMPLCSNTYRVYTFNYQRTAEEALETWGHQLEAELGAIDPTLFGIFQGPSHPAATNYIGRCGSVHNPPNATSEYDRSNETAHTSDCLDWNPDSVGQLSEISCALWNCDPMGYMIWNWQNLPGKNNAKTYKGKPLRNWWDVHGDFDKIMSNSRRLTLE